LPLERQLADHFVAQRNLHGRPLCAQGLGQILASG